MIPSKYIKCLLKYAHIIKYAHKCSKWIDGSGRNDSPHSPRSLVTFFIPFIFVWGTPTPNPLTPVSSEAHPLLSPSPLSHLPPHIQMIIMSLWKEYRYTGNFNKHVKYSDTKSLFLIVHYICLLVKILISVPIYDLGISLSSQSFPKSQNTLLFFTVIEISFTKNKIHQF